ncbi:GNAT family N-acetyltransferase [Maribacter sp. MMG018]|uniref:GNAT family N-acetyltransferase n=1 Tax=Maribacter sp. MMG018 TaxID=2822688 RepID=UPI001B37F13C|nr:GNAT family N-acetyltransferase [Maribacter sp. MMG018]MBQ4915541.1 GNAT family N-acetyltransferase [Maribacter sp. MMG018]
MQKIIPYEPKYAKAFRDLNLLWLNKYFKVENKDTELLNNCQENIIDKGGYIFIALLNEIPVGCFALIKKNETSYELGKMAVSEKYQGLKIGQKMLAYAIDFAKQKDCKKIELYSSTKLDTALHIYKKFGFKEIELEEPLPYARSDVKMELII